jgi:predicted nucleic acid-binding protein
VKFWDASAIIPLLVFEPSTRQIQSLATQDPNLLVWWASAVECASALARRERDGALDGRVMTTALQRLQILARAWHEIDPSYLIRDAANRFLRVHPLRAADALQLAAAFVAAERRPSSLQMITLDERLADAARKEGFVVIEIGAG